MRARLFLSSLPFRAIPRLASPIRLIILSILATTPTSLHSTARAEAACQLSDSQRKTISAELSGAASETPYANSWHPCELQPHCYNFLLSTQAGELVGPKGKIVLFRIIGGRYAKGFTGAGKKNWIENEGNAYSYSLAPNIIYSWGPASSNDCYALIAIQDFRHDRLRYPKRDDKEAQEFFRKNPDRYPPLHMRYGNLRPDTTMGEIAYYDEVKVPTKKENVVLAMKCAEFKKIVHSFGSFEDPKGTYSLKYLLKKISASPHAESPSCQGNPPDPLPGKEEPPPGGEGSSL